MKKNFRLIVYIVLALILLSLAILLLVKGTGRPSGFDVAARVNGEEIVYDEFALFMDGVRAETAAYFYSSFGVAIDQSSWHTEFEGLTPVRYAVDLALKEAARHKVEQMLMRDKGIAADISYATFLDELSRENAARAKKKKANEVVYGPLAYNAAAYYAYVHGNRMATLKERLKVEDFFAFSEEALQNFYKKNKEEYFSLFGQKEMDILIVYYTEESGSREKAELCAREIRRQGGAVADFTAPAGQEIELTRRRFDEDALDSGDVRPFPELRGTITELGLGDISDPIDVGNAFLVLQCTDETDGGYEDFELARGAVREIMFDEAFANLIDSQVQAARVEYLPDIYERVRW